MIEIEIYRRMHAGKRSFTLDVALRSGARRIALYGPSGAGKSLTIQSLAGLLRPERGRIVIDGVTLYEDAKGICLPPQARRLGYLQQDYGLFPHLTVAQNIAFGLDRGLFNPRRRVILPEQAQRWVQAFELGPVLGSFPAELSGGQRQRVALARALAVSPRLLLLDEPLAALDTDLRARMRGELAQLQAQLEIPTILITHDPQDALALADQVFNLRDGRIAGDCAPSELMLAARPSFPPSSSFPASPLFPG